MSSLAFKLDRARNLQVGDRFQIPLSSVGDNYFSGHVFVARSIKAYPEEVEVFTDSFNFVFHDRELILIEEKVS